MILSSGFHSLQGTIHHHTLPAQHTAKHCAMPRSPSPYGGGQRRRRPEVSPPDYMDEFGGRHHQPARDREADRGGRPRRSKSYRDPRPRPPPAYDSDSESPPPPRRRRDSPPPRPKAARAPPGPEDDYDDPNRPPRRRRPRDDEYYSDSRHDRPRRDAYDDRPPKRDAYDERPRRRDDYDDGYDDRPRRQDPYDARYDHRPRKRDPYDDRPRRDRDRYDDRLLRDPRDDRVRDRRRSGKDVPDWQRQAKDMFYTHALPVIKKEGPKLIMKYAGDFIGKQGGGRR
ncbi:hypothetical protein BU23DRAFT_189551 [Bimuria novae-zelandiae CBS 107.79]|uniref:Uncharacterized protein n=1 Tax=Bimuria novae-zelandiae CBS 107.79 TaxID=1447943 RepID=A0A6A5VQN3_9PLEO|nr:hypothetical protein BU23DRAFT_189551 [Bimuria novae-zelandiae CBS 107.79]